MTGSTGLRFFVDETSLGLGKMLAIARPDVVHPGHRNLPSIPTGTLDIDWMPVVSRLDGNDHVKWPHRESRCCDDRLNPPIPAGRGHARG